MSGYLINDEILLATDIEAAKESARLDAKRRARKAKKAERRPGSRSAEVAGGIRPFLPRRRSGEIGSEKLTKMTTKNEIEVSDGE